MTVYRICSSKYPNNDGDGARLNGGRWNHKGTAVLYCAATASLCALEILAHSDKLPRGMVVIAAEIPETLTITSLDETDLPSGWNDPVATGASKDIGTKWASDKSSAVVALPSAIIPQERNFLINPLHPDFDKIRFTAPQPFVFDPRLKPIAP